MTQDMVKQEIQRALTHFLGRPFSPVTEMAIEEQINGMLRAAEARQDLEPGFYIPWVQKDEDDPSVMKVHLVQDYTKYPADATDYEVMTGRAPENDDLDRLNCPEAGTPGHWSCGVCPEHLMPRHVCLCGSDKSPTHFAPKDTVPVIQGSFFSLDDVLQMARNIGYNIDCGACASIFFTGGGEYEHDENCAHRG